jgi:hypothetical protein
LNVDLIVASSIFIIFISATFLYLFEFQKQGPSWQSLVELRKRTTDLMNELLTQGNPENWDKENILPSRIGIASSAFLIPILISDSSGYNRINEPIAREIVFDENCKNLAWNGTVRIFDEELNEVPFKFVNQTFCPSGYLQKAILFFEVNVSANSSRKLQIFFYNSTKVKLKDYGNFSNLVLYLTFDEGSGNIAYDYSGNRNNGTLHNGSNVCSNPPNSGCPTWVDGKFGKALSFDGIDDYVQTTSNPIVSDNVTLVVWIYPRVISDGRYHGFAGYQGPSVYYRPFNFWVSPSAGLHWWISKSDNTQYHAGTIPNFFDQANKWYFIAFRKNGNKLDIFKYDQKISLPDSPFSDLYKPPYYWIGRIDNYFDGIIDEVRIYNRALSEEEILSHYQQPLSVKVFPRTKVSLISFEKLEALRNISYDLLKDTLQKGYDFRIDIYEK